MSTSLGRNAVGTVIWERVDTTFADAGGAEVGNDTRHSGAQTEEGRRRVRFWGSDESERSYFLLVYASVDCELRDSESMPAM